MKTIKNFLFLISAFFALFSFGDCADCEAYKTQVASDCDAILSIFQNDFALRYSSLSSIANSLYNQGQISAALSISRDVTTLQNLSSSVSSYVSSIKSTAQSLQCSANSSGSCDCASYLQSLVTLVTSTKNGLEGVLATLGSVQGETILGQLDLVERTNQDLVDILTEFLLWDGGDVLPITIQDFYNVFTAFSSITNKSYRINPGMYNSISYQRMVTSGKTSQITQTSSVGYAYPFNKDNSWSQASLVDILWGGFYNEQFMLASLNNYAYTNYIELVRTRQYLQSIDTNLVSLSEKFSIFNDFVFSSDAPLSMYTDIETDGSYHDYLTNYYIKVSKGQQSGSDNYTNWFSRVELLLAALVFQDEDDSTINTNGVPSESDKNSVVEVGSSLGQTISGFVQDGNSHVSSVDTSGKSIIRMVTSWNTAIGQTAKPAPFVVAEFSAPDSQSRSNISLYFDTEDEKLSSLIEIGHGISTLAWVSIFLLLGYNLAVYSIRVLRRLISFSFSLYSAIFGGG